MPLSVFIKESAECSAAKNWVKEQLEGCEVFFTDSIEGYTVDESRGVILLMDRAKVDYDEILCSSEAEVLAFIKKKDGKGNSIERKINLANKFGIDFRYCLYSESSTHHVWVYQFGKDSSGKLETEFTSFSDFGIWLDTKRTMTISKGFGHSSISAYDTSQFTDLPHFDQTLRKNKTPWLANIDGFVSDKNGEPIAILEYQNTRKSPQYHCNNVFFLSGEDINRFKSAEIVKLHSRLPFYILVWSHEYSGFKIKELDCCAYPETNLNSKGLVSSYFPTNKSPEVYNNICTKVNTKSLSYDGRNFISTINYPPLSLSNKTFPHMYYLINTFHVKYCENH